MGHLHIRNSIWSLSIIIFNADSRWHSAVASTLFRGGKWPGSMCPWPSRFRRRRRRRLAQEAMPQHASGGSAPLTLNLLLPKSARGLPNLALIPQTCQTLHCPWAGSNEFTPNFLRMTTEVPLHLSRCFRYAACHCQFSLFYFGRMKLKEI